MIVEIVPDWISIFLTRMCSNQLLNCIRLFHGNASIVSGLKPVLKLIPDLTELIVGLNLSTVEDIYRLTECLFSITELD